MGSFWRKAVNKGLKVPFSEIPAVRSTIQCVLEIPFVPLEDIEETFDLIVINAPPDDVAENLKELLN